MLAYAYRWRWSEVHRNCRMVSFISPKGSGLPKWEAGRSILPGSADRLAGGD
jgi:hypothetical protein